MIHESAFILEQSLEELRRYSGGGRSVWGGESLSSLLRDNLIEENNSENTYHAAARLAHIATPLALLDH